MASKNKKDIKSFSVSITLCTLLLIIFLMSCQTMSHNPDAFFEGDYLLLDKGASVYLFADVQQAKPIIDLLFIEELNDEQVRQMIDRTSFAVAAFFPEDSGRRFQLAAWGRYPGLAGVAFAFNKDWEKRRSATGRNYWRSASNGISAAVTSRQVFVLQARAEPADPYTSAPGIEIPEGFNEFRQGNRLSRAPLSCWIDNPAPSIFRVLNQAGIPVRFPVQNLFFNLFPVANNRYEAVIRLQFENASQARGMAAILGLAGGFTSDDPNMMIAALFLANSPVQNGRNVDIKTAVLTEMEITQLLKILQ